MKWCECAANADVNLVLSLSFMPNLLRLPRSLSLAHNWIINCIRHKPIRQKNKVIYLIKKCSKKHFHICLFVSSNTGSTLPAYQSSSQSLNDTSQSYGGGGSGNRPKPQQLVQYRHTTSTENFDSDYSSGNNNGGGAIGGHNEQQQQHTGHNVNLINNNLNTKDLNDHDKEIVNNPLNRGPYFDISASKNVTALVGKTAYLNCRIKNLGNKTVSEKSYFQRFA